MRHEHYNFLLDNLVILSIHNYTLIYWHYCYVIIIIIIILCNYTLDQLLCVFMTNLFIYLFKSATLFNTVLNLFIYIPTHFFTFMFRQ